MGTTVDDLGSLSSSSLLAQCTHPSAAMMLAAKGLQLSLSPNNFHWLKQELPCLVGFFKVGTALWGSSCSLSARLKPDSS